MTHNLASFTDVLSEDNNSQPISLPSSTEANALINEELGITPYQPKGTGQKGEFRSVEEIDQKYRDVFTYPLFNLVQSRVLEDALYSDKSMVVCAPTGSGKTVIFEMAIVHLLRELDNKRGDEDFKIIYMAPVKALCTEKLTEWYPKFTKLGLLCIEVTGDTDVDFSQLKPYRLIITTPEKWDMLTRRWRDHKSLVEVVKLFLIDEVHILNDEVRGPVLEAVVSRMKTIESSAQSEYRIEQLQKEIQGGGLSKKSPPSIRFVAVSATVSNPEDVAAWLGTDKKPAVFYKFGDECRPVKLNRIVEGYQCTEGTSIFKFDIILNYKLWPIIQKYHHGKPTLIFCNTRKSVLLTAETLSRELTVTFNAEQKAKLTALASTLKNKKLQAFVLSGVGCHHAGLLFEERTNIERAFRNRDLPILITTTTLAMGVNLPAHLVIIKNTQQYVNGAYQEYSISTVLQMVGRAGRPQFDTEATAVIMTRAVDKSKTGFCPYKIICPFHDKRYKHRYQALVGGTEPLQSYLHRRLAENLNSEAALGTVGDVAQCVQWLRSTFLFVRAAKDPKRYLGLPQNSPPHLISKKIEELCVKAMNGLASSGLITMDDASCIQSTEAGRLMSIFYLDLETMKLIMKIQGTESLERLLWLICESHELADMHLRVDERRCLNALNRNNAAATIRFPMKGKINSRQMKLNCVIQAILGCLPIPDPSLGQEAMKIMRIADRVCKCVVSYVTRPDFIGDQPEFYTAVHNTIVLAKCINAHLWENSHFVSKQLKGIGPTFSTLLASAGKVNFMLLEESHPRDLERIMNKGPPAGNVLRKQISLLPKYQLTISPIDENTVTLQLVLLNHSHLIDNTDQLTAGESHRSYIIAGDSYNHILLLKSFKDKDLMCLYDGIIKYEIKRKHQFEHKIFAHCISSSFVGVDVQSEYLFKDLEHLFGNIIVNADTQSKKPLRQRCITETFKERKRKGDTDIAQSKEKKKRDNNIMEKLKSLKESFQHHASKDFKVNYLVHPRADNSSSQNNMNKPKVTNFDDTKINMHEDNEDDYIDDDKIDSLLIEIENEISKSRPNQNDTIDRSKALIASETSLIKHLSVVKSDSYTKSDKGVSLKKKCKPITNKSNYNFIDLLEKNTDLSDEEDTNCGPLKHNGFSETIKKHINQYLQVTDTKTKVSDKNLELLLEESEIHQSKNAAIETIHLNKENVNVSDDIAQYKIKEIIEPEITKSQRNISNGTTTKQHEDQYLENISKQNQMQDEIYTNGITGKGNAAHPNILGFDSYITKYEHSNSLAPFFYLDNTQDIVQLNILSKDSTQRGEDKEMDHSNNLQDLKLNDIGKRSVTLIDDNQAKDIIPYEITNTYNYYYPSDYKSIQYDSALFRDHINKPTIFMDAFKSNICENSSIEAPHSNNTLKETTKDTALPLKNEFVNKYSYSATKIDVCTKTLPEHSIHLIRKVKMDVDITEIISRKKDLSHDALHNQVNSKYSQQETKELQRCAQEVPKNDNIKTDYKTSDHVNTNLEAEISSDLQKDEIFINKLDDTRNCLNIGDEQLKEYKILGSSKGIDTIFMEKTRANSQTNLRACAEDIKQHDESLLRNENTAPDDDNNVKNILQKYRKILGTEPMKDIFKDNVPSKLADVTISQKVKHKRPFKIGDIHKLNVPLPNNIIDDTTEYRTTEYDDIVSTGSIVVHNMFGVQEEKCPMACHQIANEDIPEYELSNDYLEEVTEVAVEDINSEINEDINIDQTMLDPKTLLQIVVGENELIPPPPEFRDETDYNPEYEFDHEYLGPLNESIFDDDTTTELTPSKEIETCTLAREDSCDNTNVVQFNSPKSFTMMRKNTPDILANTMQDAFEPRRARLGKFKFDIKSKLRVKK